MFRGWGAMVSFSRLISCNGSFPSSVRTSWWRPASEARASACWCTALRSSASSAGSWWSPSLPCECSSIVMYVLLKFKGGLVHVYTTRWRWCCLTWSWIWISWTSLAGKLSQILSKHDFGAVVDFYAGFASVLEFLSLIFEYFNIFFQNRWF